MVAARGSRAIDQSGGDTRRLGTALIILVLFFFFEYMRPQSYWILPILAPLRIPLFLTLALFVIFLKNDKDLLQDKLVVYVGLFIFLIGFTVIFAPNTYHVWKVFLAMSMIYFCVVLVMPKVCDDEYKLRRFFNIWVIINVLLAGFGITHNGHGPGNFLFDENDLSLALNMCIPIAFYQAFSKTRTKKQRLLFKLATIILVIASGATMSRGGFLGLLAVTGMFWLMSESRMKSLGVFLAVVLVAGYPVYKLVPDNYKDEMSTIFISEDNDTTRQDRFEFWGYGWEMFLDNPVFGVGAANFPWTVHLYQLRRSDYDPDSVTLYGGRPAHSLYFTLIPELGMTGIILFFLILKQVIGRLRRIIAMGRASAAMYEYAVLSKGLLVSTVAYLVTGAFISVLYYPPFWYLVAFVITLDRIAGEAYRLTGESGEDAAEGHSYNRNSRARGRGNHSRAGSRWTKGRV